MTDVDTIRTAIEKRLDELASEAASLRAARAILTDEPSIGPAAVEAPARRRASRAPRRRRPSPQASGSEAAPTNPPAPVKPEPAAAAKPKPAPAKPEPAAAAKPKPAPAEPEPAAADRPTRPSTQQRRSRQPAEPLSTQTVEGLLSESGGLSALGIAHRTGASFASARTALESLAASGLARRSGSHRTGIWRLLTDEERIAERMAELEAQIAATSAASTPAPAPQDTEVVSDDSAEADGAAVVGEAPAPGG